MITNDIVLTKFKRLLERIPIHPDNQEDPTTKDFLWVREIINELLNDLPPRKIDLLSANQLWKKYTTMSFETNLDIWNRLDEELNEGRKINAIKIYKETFGCTLRVAKDAMDARQIVLYTNRK